MWPARLVLAFLALASPVHAVEYKPDTREALLFRPEKPTQRLNAPQTCIDRPAKPQRVTWVLKDRAGNVLIVGAVTVRQRC